MKVLHIINGLERGGAERTLTNLVKNSQAAGIKNIVISLLGRGAFADEIESSGATLYAIDIRKFPVVAFLTIIREIRKSNVTVVQGWMYHANFISFIVRLIFFSGAKLIVNIRHSIYDLSLESRASRISIYLGKLVTRFADSVIYNSLVAKQQHEAYGYRAKNASVIHNGFGILPLSGSKNKFSNLSDGLNRALAEGCTLVCKLARFHHMKGYEVYLEACSLVKIKYPDVRFLCVGRGTDSKEFSTLVEKFDLTNEVIIIGELEMPRDVLLLSDIAVNAAHTEGMPNAVGESMEAGLPCVATDVGDTRELFVDRSFVVEKNNPQQLAAKILSLVSMSVQARNELGEANRMFIKTRFNAMSVTQEYKEHYKN
ncbi:MAG: glycosyltransferase [Colwellia sp.]